MASHDTNPNTQQSTGITPSLVSQEASSLKDVSDLAITLFLQILVMIYEHRLSHLSQGKLKVNLCLMGLQVNA